MARRPDGAEQETPRTGGGAALNEQLGQIATETDSFIIQMRENTKRGSPRELPPGGGPGGRGETTDSGSGPASARGGKEPHDITDTRDRGFTPSPPSHQQAPFAGGETTAADEASRALKKSSLVDEMETHGRQTVDTRTGRVRSSYSSLLSKESIAEYFGRMDSFPDRVEH